MAAAPPPPSGPPARPPLRRSRTDKVVGGVAGGLADYSGVDALLWRVGFVVLALAGPGLPAYLVLWLFMATGPAAPGQQPDSDRRAAEPRSPLPRITLAALLVVVGTLVLISRFTAWDVGPRAVLGCALLIVGLGLVTAAFTGGRRAKGGLIALGALLVLALMAVGAEPWRHVDGGIGDRTFRPGTADEVRPVYDAGVGNVLLDLSDVDLRDLDGPVTTRLDAGVGNVEILVPRSADVRIEVDSGIGNVDVFDDSSGDGLYPGLGSASWTGDDEPEFVITIDAGIGDVEVSRA